jgi:hypothetical protein
MANGPVTASVTVKSNVPASAVAVTIAIPNNNRVGLTVFNDSPDSMYISLGAGVSATDFTVLLLPNGFYEMEPDWTGQVDVVWTGVTGFARVTELSNG